MSEQSLVRRAVLLVLLAEFLCAVALSCAALLHESRTRLRAFDATLQGRSDSLLGAIQDAEDPGDNVEIDPTELRLPGTDIYAVYNQGGRLVGVSPSAAELLTTRGADGFRSQRVGRHQYRVYQREALRIIDRAESRGVGYKRPVTILYAAATDFLWHEVHEAAGFYAVVSAALLLLTAAVLILVLRKLLRPLEGLAIEATAVTADQLHFTPPAAAMRVRELRPLAVALSGAIARLRLSFEMEQQFMGDAAHELKTAVAVVRSSVQVLSMRPRSESEYRRGLDRILTDNGRVESLLTRMLTLARLEESAEPAAGGDDLGRAVERTLQRVESYAEAHDVQLQREVTRGLRVPLSAERAETLVSNLVMNAVQHSSRGAVVTVAVERDGTGHGGMLAVRDHGSGISAEALPHVFDRFFREDTSRSRETGGAGLGLAICKSIVDAAGGTIKMESEPGVGTTVRVIFSRA